MEDTYEQQERQENVATALTLRDVLEDIMMGCRDRAHDLDLARDANSILEVDIALQSMWEQLDVFESLVDMLGDLPLQHLLKPYSAAAEATMLFPEGEGLPGLYQIKGWNRQGFGADLVVQASTKAEAVSRWRNFFAWASDDVDDEPDAVLRIPGTVQCGGPVATAAEDTLLAGATPYGTC